jgi:hypothetical protein
MAVIDSEALAESQIRLRWRETYVTEGVGKALAMHDRGCYRGGYVKQASPTANKTVRINDGGEGGNCWLWQDLSTGVCLVLNKATDTVLDLASLFSDGGAIPAGGATAYICVDAVYATGTTTTATFSALDAALSGNQIPVGVVVLAEGAVEITDADIHIVSPYRLVAPLDRVILRRVAVAKTPSGTYPTCYFQITGKVYWPGGTAGTRDDRTLISLAEYNVGIPYHRDSYVGDDNGFISVADVYADSACTTSIVADNEGFITNPYVKLDFTLTTDQTPPNVRVFYWERATLRDIQTDDLYVQGVQVLPHASEINVKDVAGSPTALTGKTAQTAIDAIVAAVNERISEIAPETAPATPVQLWRSHGIASDAAVTGDTITIYWGSTLGFAVIVGAYISGDDVVIAPVTPADVVTMMRLCANEQYGPMLLSKHGTFTTFAWANLSNWGAYTRVGQITVGGLTYSGFDIGGALFNVSALLANFLAPVLFDLGITVNTTAKLLNSDSYLNGDYEPGAGAYHTYSPIWRGGVTSGGSPNPISRIYFGPGGVLIMTTNARWSDGSPGAWIPDSDAHDAKAIQLDTLLGITTLAKYKASAGFATGWSVLGWDAGLSAMTLSGDTLTSEANAVPVVSGLFGTLDEIKICLNAQNPDAISQPLVMYQAVTFHAQFLSVPTHFEFVLEHQQNVADTPEVYEPTPGYVYVDTRGCLCHVDSDTLAQYDPAYWYGAIRVSY